MFRPKVTPKGQKQEVVDLMTYPLDSKNRLTHAFFMDIFRNRSKWLFRDYYGAAIGWSDDYFIIIDSYGAARKIHDSNDGHRRLNSLLYDESGKLKSRYVKIRLRDV